MKKLFIVSSLGVLVSGAGLFLAGCSFNPELSKTAALTMIQAEYDKRPAEPITIAVDDMGLKQGLSHNLWKLTKIYPNQRWADYTLTDEGKKAVKLQGGGDVIQWRPEQGHNDFHFFMLTAQANHLKAKEVGDPHDDVAAGVDTAKGATFSEVQNFDNVPDSVALIGHNAINKVSTRRQAEFALVSGNWTLHSIN